LKELQNIQEAFHSVFDNDKKETHYVTDSNYNAILAQLDDFGFHQVAYTPLSRGLWKILTTKQQQQQPKASSSSSSSASTIETSQNSSSSSTNVCDSETSYSSLSLEQFIQGLNAVVHATKSEKAKMTFQVFDKDGDGLISREELHQFYLETYEALMERLRNEILPKHFQRLSETEAFQKKLVETLRVQFLKQLDQILDQFIDMLANDNGEMTRRRFTKFLSMGPIVAAQYEIHLDESGKPTSAQAAKTSKMLKLQTPLSFLNTGKTSQEKRKKRKRRRKKKATSNK